MIAYIVQNGDTLVTISNRFNVPVKKILEHNWVRNDLRIFPGRILFIPRNENDNDDSHPFSMSKLHLKINEILYVVQEGDTLTAIARRYDTTVDAIVEANNLAGPGATIYPGQILVIPILEFY